MMINTKRYKTLLLLAFWSSIDLLASPKKKTPSSPVQEVTLQKSTSTATATNEVLALSRPLAVTTNARQEVHVVTSALLATINTSDYSTATNNDHNDDDDNFLPAPTSSVAHLADTQKSKEEATLQQNASTTAVTNENLALSTQTKVVTNTKQKTSDDHNDDNGGLPKTETSSAHLADAQEWDKIENVQSASFFQWIQQKAHGLTGGPFSSQRFQLNCSIKTKSQIALELIEANYFQSFLDFIESKKEGERIRWVDEALTEVLDAQNEHATRTILQAVIAFTTPRSSLPPETLLRANIFLTEKANEYEKSLLAETKDYIENIRELSVLAHACNTKSEQERGNSPVLLQEDEIEAMAKTKLEGLQAQASSGKF